MELLTAARLRLDKKCGKSGVPDNTRCRKPTSFVQKAAIVGAVAAGSAALGYLTRRNLGAIRHMGPFGTSGVGKPRGGRSPEGVVSEWTSGFDIPTPGMVPSKHHTARNFAFTKNAPELKSDLVAERFSNLKGKPGVIDENVDFMEKFIRKNGITVNSGDHLVKAAKRKPELERFVRMAEANYALDGLYIIKSSGVHKNTVYVNPKRKSLATWDDASEEAVRSVNQVFDRLGRADKRPLSPKETAAYMTTWNRTTNGDAHDLITATHEIGHAIHDSSSFHMPPSIKVSGKTVKLHGDQDAVNTLFGEFNKHLTPYGRTDMGTNALESFAESFVYYIHAGKKMQKSMPYTYGWVDAIINEAKKVS
jgi:hypothetical protein